MSNNDRIYDKLDKMESKIERKLDKQEAKLEEVDKGLSVYNEQLKYHIEGVKQLKVENVMLRDYIDLENTKLQNEIQPIKNHVQKINSFWDINKKILGFIVKLSGAAGILITVYAKLTGKI